MEFTSAESAIPQFSNPEEEITFLRAEVAKRERALSEAGYSHETAAHELVNEYRETVPSEVLKKSYAVSEREQKKIILDLAPELHDSVMSELLTLIMEKGVRNTLAIVEKMNDPHIEDDLHRFLIQYLKSGLPAEIAETSPLGKSLKMTLYEVALPEGDFERKERDLKTVISKMEQFYAGMLAVSSPEDQNIFTLEIANSDHQSEVVFYVGVPDRGRDLFEKQILSIFPNAKIVEKKDDYNIFAEGGVTAASVAEHTADAIFPLKTYEAFDYDPLNILLNAFSKIKENDEGAAFQIVFRPTTDRYVKKYRKALEDILKGIPAKEALNKPNSVGSHLAAIGKDFLKSAEDRKKEKEKNKDRKPDDIVVDSIKAKIETPIVEANIRIAVSSKDKADAERILNELESAFRQFDNPTGNGLKFSRVKDAALRQFDKDFSFRMFSEADLLPLSIREATSLMHFPDNIERSPQLRQAKAGSAPAPFGLPTEGLFIGTNLDRNIEKKIFITPEDRLRHMYVIGQTGTGKTVFLKNAILQDIANGDGCCFIDPHGSDIQDILANIPPERYEDVIYFDPAALDRPMALNMLEYDPRFPEQKTFVVNEMVSIFNKLFDMKTAGGPMFEQYFRNATLLIMDSPESGSTLLEIPRVLANKAFREMKLAQCKNPIVVQFWREIADKAGGEASLANIIPYITSKFDVFLSNDIMRPIVAQQESSFNFRDMMDSKKIFLVNLSKGRLGDINSSLIGLILVGKLLMAALSRAGGHGATFPPFYLYIDEFQNVTTDSIEQILSEARKYKLSLTVAHQFIAQLEEGIKDAVFGNVGSMAVFASGADDAEYLEKQFQPVFSARDIMNIDNLNCYVKMLAAGKPVKPFNVREPFPPKGNPAIVPQLQQLSYLKFGKPRAEVEAMIVQKYQSMKAPTLGVPPPATKL